MWETPVGKLIYSMSVSLDGFVETPDRGAGTSLFPALDARIDLMLVETRPFTSGVVYLRYSAMRD